MLVYAAESFWQAAVFFFASRRNLRHISFSDG
jgi:hypothetical protein